MNPKLVDIFIPCFVDQIYPEVGFNMVKVLEKLGCEVRYNPQQTCCGQPAYNAGFFGEGEDAAKKFLRDFADKDRYIVAPSASCVGMVRNSYETYFLNSTQEVEFLALRARIFEFSEFLTEVLKVDRVPGAKLEGVATYHDSCSALRECGISAGPRKLLSHVEGLELRELAENDNCCGFGGTFAVKFPDISMGMAAQKMENAVKTEAQYLISTDSSCLLHLSGYSQKNKLSIKSMHLADVLASGW